MNFNEFGNGGDEARTRDGIRENHQQHSRDSVRNGTQISTLCAGRGREHIERKERKTGRKREKRKREEKEERRKGRKTSKEMRLTEREEEKIDTYDSKGKNMS